MKTLKLFLTVMVSFHTFTQISKLTVSEIEEKSLTSFFVRDTLSLLGNSFVTERADFVNYHIHKFAYRVSDIDNFEPNLGFIEGYAVVLDSIIVIVEKSSLISNYYKRIFVFQNYGNELVFIFHINEKNGIIGESRFIYSEKLIIEYFNLNSLKFTNIEVENLDLVELVNYNFRLPTELSFMRKFRIKDLMTIYF